MINPKDHIGLLWLIAASVYKKYHCQSSTIEDLVGYGYFGLMKACEKFDSKRTYVDKNNKIKFIKFSTYAHYHIFASMQTNILKYDSLIRTPALKQNIFQIHSNCQFEIGKEEEIEIEVQEEKVKEKLKEERRNEDMVFLLKILSPVQKEVIIKYYYEHKTTEEISIEKGCGINNITRIKNEAIHKMKHYANK